MGSYGYKPVAPPRTPSVEVIAGISSEKYQSGVTEKVVSETCKTDEGKDALPTVPMPTP